MLQITRWDCYKLLAHFAINYSQGCYKLLADNFFDAQCYKLLALCKVLNISVLYINSMAVLVFVLSYPQAELLQITRSFIGLGEGRAGQGI